MRLLSTALLLLALGSCVQPSQRMRGLPGAAAIARPVPESVPGSVPDVTTTLPSASWRELGRSLQNRPIRVAKLGTGPRRVLWVGGIHGTEREGATATARLGSAFRLAGLAKSVQLTVVEDVNPDGSAQVRRGNARGVDLNRNFPARNFRPSRFTGRTALSEPESTALYKLIVETAPHLVIVCHSMARGPFINYDGPAKALAQLFAAQSGYPVVASSRLHATPGSLGSWVGRDRETPILTIEYRRGEDSDVAWQQTRSAILAVVGARTTVAVP